VALSVVRSLVHMAHTVRTVLVRMASTASMASTPLPSVLALPHSLARTVPSVAQFHSVLPPSTAR